MQVNTTVQQMYANFRTANRDVLDKIEASMQPREQGTINITEQPGSVAALKADAWQRARLGGNVVSFGVDASGKYTSPVMPTDEQIRSGQVVRGETLSLSTLDFNLKVQPFSTDNVGAEIDYIAASYITYQNHINQYVPEADRAEQLAKLDSIINSAINRYADKFSEQTGAMLNKNGFEGEASAIKQSILNVYNNRVSEYHQFVDANPDYAGVKGTEDEWMLQDENFMRGMLQHAMRSNPADTATSDAPYSEDDLQALGYMYTATNEVKTYTLDEIREKMAAQHAAYAMKAGAVLGKLDVGAMMRRRLEALYGNTVEKSIDNANAELAKYRNESGVEGEKDNRYRPYDKDAILDMVKQIMDGLQNGKTASELLKQYQSLAPALFAEPSFSQYGLNRSMADSYNALARSLGITELLQASSFDMQA